MKKRGHLTWSNSKRYNITQDNSGSDLPAGPFHYLETRGFFLRRHRSHLTRSISKVKSELGPTEDVLRTGSRGAIG